MDQLLNLNGQWALILAKHDDVKNSPYLSEELCPENLPENITFTKVDAIVPGNFELDLHRASLLPDLYMGTNPLQFQQLEDRHLWYIKDFETPQLPEGDLFLRFDGIDTYATIYLNGICIGESDNMLIEQEFAIKPEQLKESGNRLCVHIYPTAIKAREYAENALANGCFYNEDSLNVRKAPYMFGWDIMSRAVSGGLWKNVCLIAKPRHRIEDFHLGVSRIDPRTGILQLSGQLYLHTDDGLLSDYEAIVTGVCGDSRFSQKLLFWGATKNFFIPVTDPKYWWPKGEGEQNLYRVEVRLYRKGSLVDTYNTRLGIRFVELLRTSVVDENGNGKFEFLINGRKVFIMGTNWVPLDTFPSQHEARLPKALELLEDIGCNMVRLWGGNVYESDAFYDWCDEHGILLWQDFIMGCGVYPQHEDFCRRLRQEAIAAVKRLRHHPSIVLWAGDNECDVFHTYTTKNGQRLDPNTNVLTRKVLPEVLKIYDGYRPYLPSSPYIDDYAFKMMDKLRPAEDHLWGARNYFKSSYYLNANAFFASETGFHGSPSVESLKKFIRPEKLWPIVTPEGRPNEDYTTHAASMEIADIGPYEYRIALVLRQVAVLFSDMPDGNIGKATAEETLDYLARMKTLFGNSPDALTGIAKASQIFQAESFKYMIERFRIRKATHGGLIWWNLIDGWPQISDAIVDYYYTKKLAYDYIKNSQQPLCLMFDEPDENNKLRLVAANEMPQDKTFTYTVTRMNDHCVVAQGNATIEKGGVLTLQTLQADPDKKEMFYITWQCDGETGHNHFINNIRGIGYNTYLQFLEQTGIGHFEGF